MKRIILITLSLTVSTIFCAAFSQSRTVLTGPVGRSVITTDTPSNNGNDIWKQLEQERIEAEKAEQERIATEKAEQERIAAEKKAEQEKVAAEKAEQERLAAEKKAEQEKLAAEKKAEQERLAAEKKVEQERLAAEKKAEQERLAAEKKAEQERLAAEKTAHKDSIRTDRKERIAAYPWTHIVLFNGAYALYPEYAVGITYACVKQWGFYISAMTSPSFLFNYDYNADEYGNVDGEYLFYSEKKKSMRLTATVGTLVRMRAPVYFYAGAGYGYRGVFYETTDGKWAAWHTQNTVYHGMSWEAGIMGNIKGFGLSAGISGITDFNNIYYEAKIGIGFCINKKKS